MGQKAITIQTPDSEAPHITAEDDAFIYSSLAGVKNGILGDLTCAKVDDTTIELSGGGTLNRGHALRIPDGDTLTLSADSGTTGYKRYDSVVAEFVRGGSTTADSYTIKIIKGTSSTSSPTAPQLTTSNLANQGDVNQVELFRLYLNGTTLSSITQMIDKVQDANAEQLTDYVYDKINQRTYQQSRAVRYGIKINKLESDPATRIEYIYDAEGMTPAHMDFDTGTFDYGDWENVFFVKENRPVMLNSDRTVAYELDPNDYSKKLNGTASKISDASTYLNAMSEFPLIWLCQYEVDNYEYIIVSNKRFDETYRADAYTREDGTIAKYMYLPIYGGSYDGTKLRSLSGKVMMSSSTNARTEINLAAAVGDGWTIIPWCRRNLINCLLLIIGKSENVKTVFGKGNISGYVYSVAQNYGKLNTGTLDDKGQFYGTNDSTSQVKVFHMEKWWGDRFDRVVGYISDKSRIKVKMSPPYNLTASGYVDTGIDVPTTEGYQKDSYMTRFGRFPKTTAGASATTYLCAYCWINLEIVAIALVGGNCITGASCSAACVDLDGTATYSNWDIGASLSCESPIDAEIDEMYAGAKDTEAREELEEMKNDYQIATMAEFQAAIDEVI